MFFKSKKKIAQQIAQAIIGNITAPFIYTEYLKGNEFNPPEDFWEDEYIVGFIHHLIGLMVKFDFRGDAWSADKKGLVTLYTLKFLCGDSSSIVADTIKNSTYASQKSPEYERGGDDATSMYLCVSGRLKLGYTDSLINDAKALVDALEADMGPPENYNSSLGAAVGSLTIAKHIEETYINKEAA